MEHGHAGGGGGAGIGPVQHQELPSRVGLEKNPESDEDCGP